MEFQKPNVVVSRCIEFDSCRYNGLKISDKFVEKLVDYVNFHPVCPEVEIGLGVPREPIRIVVDDGRKILYQPATERILTGEMEEFTENFLGSLDKIDGFILKNRSPSCGIKDVKIYHGLKNLSGVSRGSGFFGGAVIERFDGLAIEDEGRLNNFLIREHFLTKLYTMRSFRQVKEEKNNKAKINKLIEFHTKNKFLFMGYNQNEMRTMGNIVANHEKEDIEIIIKNYGEHLKKVLLNVPECCSMINSIQHAFGRVSKDLKKDEKAFFTGIVEQYRDERIPLSTIIHLLKSYAIRFNDDYLLSQSFLIPYPEGLVEMIRQGKRH